ncbi:efflux RND transporter periplasmic adaptor subunit [Salinisphaera sp. T31B1]|uniref:efflux RND transporter periplasmic adaptor subunit n=1 Tax=Salinisphaera sp. T31B1 TaxID=727963 RepID=UPI00333FBC5B
MNMSSEPTRPPRRRAMRLLRFLLPVIVLAISVAVAFIVLDTKPTAPRAQAKPRQARLVTVTPAEAAPPTLDLQANGTVEAADATELRARVSGQVVALTDRLAPGTRFDKGDVLARIDASDYRIALSNARSELASARAALRVEQGQQAVARRELSLVGSKVSADERDLALRGPQLEQAKADVQSAQAAVDQARLDLGRTDVTAPFAGIVTERSASIGDVVTTSDTLATIAATDVYWVDVSLPVDQLRWLRAAGAAGHGSPAAVFYPDAWGAGASVEAEVLRIQPALEADGRMARVLLRVPDPLGPDKPDGAGLLLGAYVAARIQADIPSGSVLVDAAFVHENNQIWVMSDTGTLDIRSVNIAYRDANQAVIAAGLAPGEEVITSELTAPIQGMPIRVETADADRRPRDPSADTDVAAAGAQQPVPAEAIDRSLDLRLVEAPAQGLSHTARADRDDGPRS